MHVILISNDINIVYTVIPDGVAMLTGWCHMVWLCCVVTLVSWVL